MKNMGHFVLEDLFDCIATDQFMGLHLAYSVVLEKKFLRYLTSRKNNKVRKAAWRCYFCTTTLDQNDVVIAFTSSTPYILDMPQTA